jgi:hypothetical protein
MTNAQRTGPAGVVEYLIEIATDAAMASKVVSVVQSEGNGATSYTVPFDLAASTRFYWRAKALDPGHESAFTGIRSFVTPGG